MDSESEKKVSTSSSAKQMPSIGELFSQSWDTFKKSWLHLLVFNLVTGVILGVVLLLFIVVIGLTVGISGASSVFSSGQPNFAALGGLVIGGGIATFIFLVFCIAFAILVEVGNKLIVSVNGKMSLDETIKKSPRFIVPIFIIGIVSFLIIWGGYFLFFIPGLVFSIFFMFFVYEIIFADKRWLDALRSSMGIVKQNFWGIFGRLLLIGLIACGVYIAFYIVQLIITLVLGEKSLVAISLTFLIVIAQYIFQIAFAFYTTAYSYTLYRHAKDAAGDKKGSLLWPTIISVIGWALIILIGVSFGGQMVKALSSKEFQQAFQKSSSSKSTNYNSSSYSTSGKVDASTLEQSVFNGVNAARKKMALPAIVEDSQLCAYAQRRLEQLTKYGKWDDAKGFYEDTANPQIARAYFQNLANVNEEGWNPVTSETTASVIVSAWANRKPGTGIVPNANYTLGCIRGTGDFLIFIGGAK